MFIGAIWFFEPGDKPYPGLRGVRCQGKRAVLFAALVGDVKRKGKPGILTRHIFHGYFGLKPKLPYIWRCLTIAQKTDFHITSLPDPLPQNKSYGRTI